MFITNTCASFHLWWKENLGKHQKVPKILWKSHQKYYENDCGFFLICYFPLFLKKRNKTWLTYINKQNQEAFIVYNKLWIASFSSAFAIQNIIFKKIPTLRIK